MESIVQSFPQLIPYYPSLVALALLCLMVLVQSFLAGLLGLSTGEEIPGLPLKGDHTKLSFRVVRTYHNSIENFSVMTATTMLAILAGTNVTLVNWLVGLHVLIRLIYWGVYYSGTGKVAGGPRTITYVAALLMNVILAFATTYALLF